MGDRRVVYVDDHNPLPISSEAAKMHRIIRYLRHEREVLEQMKALEMTVDNLMWRNVRLFLPVSEDPGRVIPRWTKRPSVENISVAIQPAISLMLREIDDIKQELHINGAPDQIREALLRRQRALHSMDPLFQVQHGEEYEHEIMKHTQRKSQLHRIIGLLNSTIMAFLHHNAQLEEGIYQC